MNNQLTYLFVIALLVVSCTRLPDAPFYEVDGIISIKAASIEPTNGWTDTPFETSVSKISENVSDTGGALTFSFYVRRSGNYSLWVLSARVDEQQNDQGISLSASDEDGFLLYRSRLDLRNSTKLTWNNREFESGEAIQIQFDAPGHYRVVFDSGGKQGYVIDKIQLSLEDQNPPVGFGYPETANPGTDPVLAKRDQRVALPPSWLFKPICAGLPEEYTAVYSVNRSAHLAANECVSFDLVRHQSDDEGEFLNNLENLEQLFVGTFNENRGLIFAPPRFLQNPEFKRFPTRWSVHERLDFREQIEIVANPRRSTYEVPFLVGTATDIFNHDYASFSEELLLRWLQFSVFHTVMLLPVEHLDGVNEHISDDAFQFITELIELRHQLHPYTYSLAHLIRATGVKPLRGFSRYPLQFRLGNAFLVAPFYEAGMQERAVYLPEGLWYRYDDGSEFEGGQSWFIEAAINELPVFVKAGSIIPYQMNTGNNSAIFDELTVKIYAGGTGTFRLYEDDGTTDAYLHGEFTTTAFRYFEHEDYATFTIGRKFRHLDSQAETKDLTLIFKYIDEPEFIKAEGVIIENGNDENMWLYDEESRTLTLNWLQYVHQKTDFFIQF